YVVHFFPVNPRGKPMLRCFGAEWSSKGPKDSFGESLICLDFTFISCFRGSASETKIRSAYGSLCGRGASDRLLPQRAGEASAFFWGFPIEIPYRVNLIPIGVLV